MTREAISLSGRGARGESFTDVARRLGQIIEGAPVESDATDAEVLEALAQAVGITVAGTIPVAPVQASPTGNVNVANPGTDVFDGVTVANGEYLLLQAQTAPAQNGIYQFNGSGSALTRRTDFNETSEVVQGAQVLVLEGNTNRGLWGLSTANPITVGTTAQSWVFVRRDDYISPEEDGTVALPGTTGIAGDLTLTRDDQEDICPEIKLRSLNSWWLGGAIDVVHNTRKGTNYVPLALINPFNNNVGDQWMVAHRGYAQATTTAGTTADDVLTVASTADIEVGMLVSGTGIASPLPKVASVDSATQVTLTENVTLDNGVALTFSDTPTFGFGLTPPNLNTYRSQFAADDNNAAMGTVSVRVGPTQTGHAHAIIDSNGDERCWVDKDFAFSPTLFRDTASPGNVVSIAKNDLSLVYAFKFSGNSIRMRNVTGGVDLWQYNTDGSGETFYPHTFNRADVKPDGSGYLGAISKADGSVVYTDRYDGDSITRRYHTGGGDIRRDNTDFTFEILGGLLLRAFTVGTLPAATARLLIYVSDGASNQRLAIGDGTNFRFPDGSIVS